MTVPVAVTVAVIDCQRTFRSRGGVVGPGEVREALRRLGQWLKDAQT